MFNYYTGNNKLVLEVYIEDTGNGYTYFEIDKIGNVKLVPMLNKVKNNPYYIDYCSTIQLQKVDEIKSLFTKVKNKDINELATKVNKILDDIPF